MEKHLFCETNMKQAKDERRTSCSKRFRLDLPSFWNVPAQDFYFERSQCEADVAIITMRLRGLMMLPGGAQWRSDVPFTSISVRYSSHFPLDTSLGQSNSTCRLPRRPSVFPLMCTYQRRKWVHTWTPHLKDNTDFRQTWNVKSSRLPTSDVLFMANSPITWPWKEVWPGGLILWGHDQPKREVK